MVSKAPRTSTVNSSPELTIIVGGVQVLTEKRVFGPVCPHVPLPMRCRRHAGYSTRAREGAISDPDAGAPMLAQLPTAAHELSDQVSGTGALPGDVVVWPNPQTGRQGAGTAERRAARLCVPGRGGRAGMMATSWQRAMAPRGGQPCRHDRTRRGADEAMMLSRM